MRFEVLLDPEWECCASDYDFRAHCDAISDLWHIDIATKHLTYDKPRHSHLWLDIIDNCHMHTKHRYLRCRFPIGHASCDRHRIGHIHHNPGTRVRLALR